MADLSYDSFVKNKDKKVKVKPLSYEAFQTKKNILLAKEENTKQGLPVSVRDDRVEPTKVGSIVRGAIKPFANVASNALLGKVDLSNKYLGKVEGLGTVDVTKSPLSKDNLKTVKKSVGTGLEIGSYLGGGGAVAKTAQGVAKQGTKQLVKQFAKEGAISTAAGSVGSQMQNGKVSLKQTAKDTAIGTALSPLVGLGLNKMIGKKAGQVTNKIDDVNTKKVDELISYEGAPDRAQVEKYKADIQSGKQLEPIKVIKDENGFGIEDGKHRYEAYKELGYKEVPVEEVTPRTEASKIATNEAFDSNKSYSDKKYNDKTYDDFVKEDPTFTRGGYDIYKEEAGKLKREDLVDIATGRKQSTEKLPATAALKFARNLPDLTPKEAKRLLNTFVKSKAGSELQAARLTKGDIFDNPVDFAEAYNTKMKANAKNKVVTNKTANRFLDELECIE